MSASIPVPGGSRFTRDVTSLFVKAAAGKSEQLTCSKTVTHIFAEMEPDSLIFAEGYTLNDAMSVFEVCLCCDMLRAGIDSVIEIGEHRLDTGLMVDPEREKKFPFNPLAPLLPEELCWIIDRSFSYEVRSELTW